MMSEVSKGELKLFLFHFFIHSLDEMSPLFFVACCLHAETILSSIKDHLEIRSGFSTLFEVTAGKIPNKLNRK